MARSVQDLIREALDAAIQQNRIDDSQRGSVIQFMGLSGGTNERGFQRYYLNGQLNEYVDIAPHDVVAEVDLAGDASPFVLVLTKGDAQIQHHVDVSETLQAGFLTGDIASRNLSHARLMAPYIDPTLVETWTLSGPWTCMPAVPTLLLRRYWGERSGQ